MKSFLILATTAAAFIVGCGDSQPTSSLEPADLTEPAKPAETAETERPPKLIAEEVPTILEQVAPEPKVENLDEAAMAAQKANRALRAAAADGDLQTLRKLLAEGADLNARDSNGKTLYEVGVPDEQTASFLRRQGAKTSRELDAEEE
ncbi:MAG: hypothetical protein AAF514_05190 [Verrucomicrobiota bacterium]